MSSGAPLGQNVDLSQFNPERSDRQKIEEGLWIPCRLCEKAFRRIRLTRRYCASCDHASCEGEHYNFAPDGHGRCVQCGPHV